MPRLTFWPVPRWKVEVNRPLNAVPWPEIGNIFRTGRPMNFKLGISMVYNDLHLRRARSKVKVTRPFWGAPASDILRLPHYRPHSLFVVKWWQLLVMLIFFQYSCFTTVVLHITVLVYTCRVPRLAWKQCCWVNISISIEGKTCFLVWTVWLFDSSLTLLFAVDLSNVPL